MGHIVEQYLAQGKGGSQLGVRLREHTYTDTFGLLRRKHEQVRLHNVESEAADLIQLSQGLSCRARCRWQGSSTSCQGTRLMQGVMHSTPAQSRVCPSVLLAV